MVRLIQSACFLGCLLALSLCASAQRNLAEERPPPDARPGASRNVALLIAIQAYGGAPAGWDSLRTPVADVRSVREALERRYGFDAEHVLVAFDVTLDGIYGAFDRLEGKVKAGDRVLIYYAGHGYLEAHTDEGFWIPRDGRRPEDAASPRPSESRTWFPNEELKRLLKRLSRARHILVVADACFSGQLGRGNDRGLREEWVREREAFELHGPDAQKVRVYDGHLSRKVFASGLYDQTVADTGGFGHSIFAHYLLEALRNNTVSAIPARALFSRVIENMDRDRRVRQTPNYSPIPDLGDAQGEFVFFSRQETAPTPSSPAPSHVRRSIGDLIEQGKGLEASGHIGPALRSYYRAHLLCRAHPGVWSDHPGEEGRVDPDSPAQPGDRIGAVLRDIRVRVDSTYADGPASMVCLRFAYGGRPIRALSFSYAGGSATEHVRVREDGSVEIPVYNPSKGARLPLTVSIEYEYRASMRRVPGALEAFESLGNDPGIRFQNRKTVQAAPGAGQDAPSPLIRSLMALTSTGDLREQLGRYEAAGDLAVGRREDFHPPEGCYVAVFDGQRVVGFLVFRGNRFYDIRSNKGYNSLSEAFSGKAQIWFRDLTFLWR